MTIGKFPSFTDLTREERRQIFAHFKSFGLHPDKEERGPEGSLFPSDRLAEMWANEAYAIIAGILARRGGDPT
jgi:hypothetical protein